MKKIKESVALFALGFFYVLCSVRYFPDKVLKTVMETLLQIVTTAPLSIGATLIVVSFLQRASGEKMPWDRVLRMYLTFGIMVEIFFGLHDYLGKG